jgi:hypothetical protein
LTKGYPELTPYQFASNDPIGSIDLDGLEQKKLLGGVAAAAAGTVGIKPVSTSIISVGAEASVGCPDCKKNTNTISSASQNFGQGFSDESISFWSSFTWQNMKSKVNDLKGTATDFGNMAMGKPGAAKGFSERVVNFSKTISDPIVQPVQFISTMNTRSVDENFYGLGRYSAQAFNAYVTGEFLKAASSQGINIYKSPVNTLTGLQSKFGQLAESSLLPKYLKIDPNLKSGFTGSFSTGVVNNPLKSTFGQSINLTQFDIDFWIESDILYKQYGPNLRADVEFRKVLSETQGFEGLKPNKEGFSIKFKPKAK